MTFLRSDTITHNYWQKDQPIPWINQIRSIFSWKAPRWEFWVVFDLIVYLATSKNYHKSIRVRSSKYFCHILKWVDNWTVFIVLIKKLFQVNFIFCTICVFYSSTHFYYIPWSIFVFSFPRSYAILFDFELFLCYTGPHGCALLSRSYGLFLVYVLWLCIGASLWVTSTSLDTVWALKLGIFILAHDSVSWILGRHEFASRNNNVNYAFLHLISATCFS